jgi:hypothetical protein
MDIIRSLTSRSISEQAPAVSTANSRVAHRVDNLLPMEFFLHANVRCRKGRPLACYRPIGMTCGARRAEPVAPPGLSRRIRAGNVSPLIPVRSITKT